MSQLYPLPDYSKLPLSRLFDKNNVNIQRYFFANDDDGRLSFNSFLAQYKDFKNWRVKRYPTFIKISSVNGNKIEIYANYPQQPQNGQADIGRILNNAYVPVWVNRTHRIPSYLKFFTDHLPQNAALVYEGNCGGYSIVSDVLKKSPNAQLWDTQGKGTIYVNDPTLYNLNEWFRTTPIKGGSFIDWKIFKDQIQKKPFAKEPNFMENFPKYKSPMDNNSAKFLNGYKALPKGVRSRNLTSDPAMITATTSPVSPTGGIDLTLSNFNMQIKNSGIGIQFHVDQAMLQELKNAPGLTIGNLTIKPLNSLPEFLGITHETSAQ